MARRRRPIYVESRIRAPLDALWDATQDPALHQRWDLRSGRIVYDAPVEGEPALPARSASGARPLGPRRFTYATTLVPGVTIAGTGESLGDRERPDGTRWSGLRFWSPDRRSLIEAGAGYWRYVPTDDGIRFLTRYDYRPRWGRAGALVDHHVVRPAFGWATAWSFDRLRLWLEEGTPPERSRDLALAHAAAVGGLAGVWLYQGLVPKLLRADADEVAMWRGALGLSEPAARRAARAVGLVEIGLASATVTQRNARWPFAVAAAAMPALAVGAALGDRTSVTRAFNPVSLNLAVAGLAIVAWATAEGRPSGRTPLRVAPDRQPGVDDVEAIP